MKNKKILFALCLILVAGIAAGLYFVGKYDRKNDSIYQAKAASTLDIPGFLISANIRQEIEEKSDGKFTLEDITNILLIGVDNDNIEGLNQLGNADGIMLVSINNNTKQVTLTSFMRDTRIRQPNEYQKKMTSIFHVGGAELLSEAIESNFHIPVDNYLLVNYLNVVELIDTLGGLDIELSADEIKTMSGKISNVEKLVGVPKGTNALKPEQAGMLHLNGIQTAAYLRIRPSSTNYDSGRTERARKVVTLIIEKLRKMRPTEKSEIANRFFPNIETDMSDEEILNFLLSTSVIMDFDLYSAKIPLDGTYTTSDDGNAFVIPDFEANNKYLYESIYEGKH